MLPLITAILLHFNEKGERKNRMAARLKFLIRKEGFDTFKAEVEKILATLPAVHPLRAGPGAPAPAGRPGGQAAPGRARKATRSG